MGRYQAVKPLNQFHDVCGLALSLFMAGQLKESYQGIYLLLAAVCLSAKLKPGFSIKLATRLSFVFCPFCFVSLDQQF